ncbi:hydantoinase/oxoprolinase family protein [Elioraea thermophila]|uniref:hydantoinase/oxoprolinase family protein n=1 Tax=Elioraea thermophila TaxID=2185104 RepID=UPI000DF2965C|nr:hydantoinase/oxoprolinase family protein [Elioraea thermophila]
MSVRLAVDIGGTFTDFALETPTRRLTAKVLTTPAEPERAVLEGTARILAEAGLAPASLDLVVHGTTLATNAIIERKGAKVAFLTTEGFRDVLAMGTESRYDQYDLQIDLPEPLVPRRLRLPVRERLDRAGRVLVPLDEEGVRALIPLLRAEGVEAVAVGFLHAFVDPRHERRVREILHEAWPDLPVSLSSEVSPEMREYERFSTTVANAYVQPLMDRYLARLEEGLRAIGARAPLLMMLSSGGLCSVQTARRFPVRLVESGPAGGALFAAAIAREADLTRVLSYDMGGTTAKVCLIDDFRPHTTRAFEVARVGRFKKGSGLPLRIPVVEMVEIGAGGGSIARVDSLGRIAVGPDSAGADPGPACYGRGGDRPTVTDANLLLGRYDPDRFAGGRLALHRDRAEAAMARDVAVPQGIDIATASVGVVEIVDEAMANAARVHAIEAGTALEGRTLIAFGGGGPVHAARVAEKIGIDSVLVPPGAGVGSAIGFLRAPVAYEVVRSLYQRLASLDLARVNALFAEMRGEAETILAQGAPGREAEEERVAFMRYVGQGHEIAVALPARALVQDDIGTIRAAYDRAYAATYDRPVPGTDVEILAFALRLAAPADPPPPLSPAGGGAATEPTTRPVRDTTSGLVSPWAIHDRSALGPGAEIAGPAIIAEDETSTLVPPGWRARIDARGFIRLSREQGART